MKAFGYGRWNVAASSVDEGMAIVRCLGAGERLRAERQRRKQAHIYRLTDLVCVRCGRPKTDIDIFGLECKP